MKRQDVKAYMLGGGSGTKKILYVITVRPDDTWVWYDTYKGYGKAASNKEAAKKIVEEEILPRCED